MKRTTIFVEEAQERELDALAASERRPKASLVREAIAEYLVRKSRDRPVPGFVGAGRSGRSEGAETHENELFEALQPHGGEKSPGAGAVAGKKRRP